MKRSQGTPTYESEAIAAIDLLPPLHKERTVIVHGLYNGKSIPDNPHLYVFGLVKWGKGDTGTVDSHIYSRNELGNFTRALADACNRMESILWLRREPPHRKQLKKPNN